MVIELANEVRKVLGLVENGISKEKMLSGPSQIAITSHTRVHPALKLLPRPEAVAMDS